MHAVGADLIDVGGESTRPGAFRVSEDEELRRILPVVRALRQAGVPVSVDTTRSRVARSSLEAGGTMINDVSRGTAGPRMSSPVLGARPRDDHLARAGRSVGSPRARRPRQR